MQPAILNVKEKRERRWLEIKWRNKNKNNYMKNKEKNKKYNNVMFYRFNI